MTKLYHKEVFAPKHLFDKLNGRTLFLDFSEHARQACRSDRYGKIIPPIELKVDSNEIIELEEDGGNIIKVVIRRCYDATRDLIIVVKPDGFVKTLWFNLRSDVHKTLDASRYVRA